MTEKEFHKLKRQEVLQLLLTQVQETERCRKEREEALEQLREMESTYERLKARLNSKDAQIHKLKGRLDKKDKQIRSLKEEVERWKNSRKIGPGYAGSIAEAALQLSGIFEAAQNAADLYLENVKAEIDKTAGTENRKNQCKETGKNIKNIRAGFWEEHGWKKS